MKKNFQQKNKALVPYEAKGFRSGFTRTPKFGVTPKGGGFTLVETLVAVSIFTVSLLGVMTVLKSGVANISVAKQKMTATYLAQEGIEYMRNIRDTVVLYEGGDSYAKYGKFRTYFKGEGRNCNGEDYACSFDNLSPKGGGSSCNTDMDCILYIDKGNYNNKKNGVNSGFVRKIWMIVLGPNSDEVKIFSQVKWAQGSGVYKVTLSENLFNWIE